MSWFKLDDQFHRHPKARAAGKDGRALFVAGGCYSAGNLTDGFIAATDLQLIAAEAEVPARKTAALLVKVGLWEVTEGGWLVHDYLDYNPSGDEVRETRRKRAEAGRKGGKKSKPPGSKPEANGEANASGFAEANEKQNGTPSPSPSPDGVCTTGLNLSSTEWAVGRDPRVVAAIEILANRSVDDRISKGHRVNNRRAYLETTRSNTWAEFVDALDALAAHWPDADPEQLADNVDPTTEEGFLA